MTMTKMNKTAIDALIVHLADLASNERNDMFREVYIDLALRLADMRRGRKSVAKEAA